MAFIEGEDKPLIYRNRITEESIRLTQGEFRPYQTEYNQRMHTLCTTLNELFSE